MVVKIEDRYAILLGRDAQYPAPIAFTLAHEIGHIALGHLKESDAVVDMEDPADAVEKDNEEDQADTFALDLLTGQPQPDIQTNIETFGPQQLAAAALDAGPSRGIEPGTLALCLAYKTKRWPVAMASLKHIYRDAKPVWQEVNSVAGRELDWDVVGSDAGDYLHAIMAIADD